MSPLSIDRNILIQKLHLKDIPRTLQDKIVGQLGENILKAITLEILQKMNPEERSDFEKIATTGTEEEMSAFLSSKIPDIEGLIQKKAEEEVGRVKQGME